MVVFGGGRTKEGGEDVADAAAAVAPPAGSDVAGEGIGGIR